MDWDAARYDRISTPQVGWGRRVLERLNPMPGERILDLGCGTGRLTAELVDAIRFGHVVGLDRSAAMLKQAAARPAHVPLHDAMVRPAQVSYVQADSAALPFVDAFDAVFSTATLHWVLDHASAFASIYRALAPGGRFIAQCGGGPNLKRLLDRARRLMASAEYAAYFVSWSDPWHFADVASTVVRLERAGFSAIDVTLEPAPTVMPDAGAFEEFIAHVCVRHHLARLLEGDVRQRFVGTLTGLARGDDPPFTLDYWRLNIAATKPAGAEQAA